MLSKSGGDKISHFKKWWGHVPSVPSVYDTYAESSLIAGIPALNFDHDELDGNGIQRDPHEFWWADPENVTEFFKQVKNFLDARAHVCRDLTHATNTKQNKDKTTSAFVSRFNRV